ncbi:MAG: hypothetical protein GXY83_12115 [Rhodopirellula sp.]|nr:hypothetical protein [Rhodopirellula sp.]
MAEALHVFLSGTVKKAKPWMSDKDIYSGEAWLQTLRDHLQQASLAIICLTPENRDRPWLHFEAGLLSNSSSKATPVCPYLFGLRASQIEYPMAQFQLSANTADEEQVFRILETVENRLGNGAVDYPLVHAELKGFLGRLPPHPPPTAGDPRVYFDCTQQEFERHLADADRVTVVGVTNEGLAGHLTAARANRQQPWKELQVVFLAKDLLSHIRDPLERQQDRDSPERRWDSAVNTLRQLLVETHEPIAERVVIRRTDRMLPFVGQLYDEHHARVAFILPERDMRDNCYINFPSIPCGDKQFRSRQGLLTGDVPPCKKTEGDYDCECCDWGKGHSPCQAIREAIKEIRSSSTPIFAANVVGALTENDETFRFKCLAPQCRWQYFRIIGDPRPPVHLLTFVLVRRRDTLLLLKRSEATASDQHGRLGVIAGKINDEDFFLEEPGREYRDLVFDMQMEHYRVLSRMKQDEDGLWQIPDDDPLWCTFWSKYLNPLTESFCKFAHLEDSGEPNPFIEPARKAAVRYVQEKLRKRIFPQELKSVPGTFVVKRRGNWLFPIVFLLDIGDTYHPVVSTQTIPLSCLSTWNGRDGLTLFLEKYAGDIVDRLASIPWSPRTYSHAN